jgi:hypothetical protein
VTPRQVRESAVSLYRATKEGTAAVVGLLLIQVAFRVLLTNPILLMLLIGWLVLTRKEATT